MSIEMSSDSIANCLEVATEAAKNGGQVLRRYWGKISQIRQKSEAGDLVTEADDEAEREVLAVIKRAYPDIPVLAEESGFIANGDSDYLWTIDPLDGTTNYTHQYPMVSVAIALLFRGKPIVGVIYNPIHDELFQGALGLGSTLNGEAIHVSKTEALQDSLLVTGFAYDRRHTIDKNYAEFCHLTSLSQGVRRGGSAALDLAYLAAGRVDGYWERGLSVWDIAAGMIIVSEAGGEVSDYDGSPLILSADRPSHQRILASNATLHGVLQDEIRQIRKDASLDV